MRAEDQLVCPLEVPGFVQQVSQEPVVVDQGDGMSQASEIPAGAPRVDKDPGQRLTGLDLQDDQPAAVAEDPLSTGLYVRRADDEVHVALRRRITPGKAARQQHADGSLIILADADRQDEILYVE